MCPLGAATKQLLLAKFHCGWHVRREIKTEAVAGHYTKSLCPVYYFINYFLLFWLPVKVISADYSDLNLPDCYRVTYTRIKKTPKRRLPGGEGKRVELGPALRGRNVNIERSIQSSRLIWDHCITKQTSCKPTLNTCMNIGLPPFLHLRRHG